jgi:hypothetical protein
MGVRRPPPREDNGPRAGSQKGLWIRSVSVCLRLEIIAILSGAFPLWEIFRRPVVMPFRPAVNTSPPQTPRCAIAAG